MRSLFSENSVFMRFFGAITNMMLVNILWLVCCLPVITAGAATTAAYYTFYQRLTGEDDAVIKPFFRAFRQNFKQATLLWIPLLLIGLLLGLDLAFLLGNFAGKFDAMWVAFIVCAFLYSVILSHAFAIIGRYDAPIKLVIRNCFLVFFMNMFRSILSVALLILPVLVLIFMPQLVVAILPAWFGLIFGAIFYFNAHMFLQSFQKTDAEQREDAKKEN